MCLARMDNILSYIILNENESAFCLFVIYILVGLCKMGNSKKIEFICVNI